MELRTITSTVFRAIRYRHLYSFSLHFLSSRGAAFLRTSRRVGLSGPAAGCRISRTVCSQASQSANDAPAGWLEYKSRWVGSSRKNFLHLQHSENKRYPLTNVCGRVCVRSRATATGTGIGEPVFLAQRTSVRDSFATSWTGAWKAGTVRLRSRFWPSRSSDARPITIPSRIRSSGRRLPGCAPASTNTTGDLEKTTHWSSRCPKAATFRNFDIWSRRTGRGPGARWRPTTRPADIFVGRQRETGRLVGAFSADARRFGQAEFSGTGEAGIGKSALAEEFLRRRRAGSLN